MRAMKLLIWGLSISLVSGAIITGSVSARPGAGSQSDIQGTNIWNNTIPSFEPGSGLDPQLLNSANQIIQELNDAYGNYQAAESRALQQPRRFARGKRNQVCVNPHTERVNRLVREAKRILGKADSDQAEILKTNPAFRAW